jgi:hypothetical protein
MTGQKPPARAMTTLPYSGPSLRYSCALAARTSYFPLSGIAVGFILRSKRLADQLWLIHQILALTKTGSETGSPGRVGHFPFMRGPGDGRDTGGMTRTSIAATARLGRGPRPVRIAPAKGLPRAVACLWDDRLSVNRRSHCDRQSGAVVSVLVHSTEPA